MVVSKGAPLAEGAFAPYEFVRELGARPVPACVVRQRTGADGKPLLVVAECFPVAAKGADNKDSDFLREARRIATLTSPNLPRVRDVSVRGEDVVVNTEFVDGEKLTELWGPDGLPLEVALRVILDVLAGVGALHNLRDIKQQPMKLAHGELAPSTIVVGLDGVARVLHAITRRQPGAQPDPLSMRSMAPEVLEGKAYDARADVYGVGVLLWEALSGRPLFSESAPVEVVARAGGADVPRATIPAKSPWAKDLVEVAARALRLAPVDRWPSAAAMAAEVRKAAGLKLATVSSTAAFTRGAIGETVAARRESLQTREPAAPAASRVVPTAQAPSPSTPESAEMPIPVDFASIPPSAPRSPLSEPPPETEVMLKRDLPFPTSEAALRVPSPPTLKPPEFIAESVRPPVHRQDVVELGADVVVDAPISIPPPPQPPVTQPPAGRPEVVFNPFTASVRAPAVASSPAAMPVNVAPSSVLAPPQLSELAVEVTDRAPSEPPVRSNHRRKAIVLGCVGGIGGIVLLLAVVSPRWKANASAHAPSAAPLATLAAAPVAAPAPPAPSSSAPASAGARPSSTPPVASAAASPAPEAPSASAVGATRAPAKVVAAPHHPPAAPHPRPAAPAKKKSKPVFDPNSL